MSSLQELQEFTDKWQKTVKPFAEQVIKECKTDPDVAQYVSAMIWWVDRDIRVGRIPGSRLYPCVKRLNSEFYYNNVHKSTGKEEVEKLRKLGEMINGLIVKNYVVPLSKALFK